jgi:PAS domain S-box-containing protein
MHGNGINTDEKFGPHSSKFIEEAEFLDGILAGAYQVDNDGNFLYCNQEAANILEYESKQELKEKNIYHLYFDMEERDILLKRMRKNKGRLKTEGIRWKRKNGLEVVINDFAEFAYDTNGNEIGVRGIFVDATYQKLFDDLNAGVYKLGPDAKTIQFVNKAVARIFGFKSPEEMEGRDISTFYRDHNDFMEFIEYLNENEEAINYPLDMKNVDGEPITISVSCHLRKDENNNIIGREGTFTDITEQKKLEQLLEQPLGVYEARLDNGNPIIYYCNETFARMFGYKTKEEVKGINIHDFYVNEEDVVRFENALKEADKKGKPLTEFLLKVRRKTYQNDKEKEYFWIEIFCFLIKNEESHITGRKGTIMDVTDRIELESVIAKREGIQNFIHGLIAPVISINSTCQILAKEVERRVSLSYKTDSLEKIFDQGFNIPSLYEKISKVSDDLTEKIDNIYDLCKNKNEHYGTEIRELQETGNMLKKETKDIARRIIEIRELQKKEYTLLHEIYSSIRTERTITNSREITDLIRLCFIDLNELDSLYLLYLGQSIYYKSTIAYHDVEGLRQLMMRFGERGEEKPLEFSRVNIIEIINQIVDLYQIDVSLKGIKINEPKIKTADIEIAPEQIKRMFSYIIENAIKYSFKREGYINVEVIDNKDIIQVKTENYGVGILNSEIQSGKIYEYGYRGEFSFDRNRTGSGIGLSEAKRIVEAHGGELTITSVPVVKTQEITQDTPHKTTVVIKLPKIQKKRGDFSD